MRSKFATLPALALCVAATLVLAPQLHAQAPGQSPMQQNPNSANPAQPNNMPNSQPGQMAPPDGGTQMQDKMFLHKASEGGMAEVQLGQLAAQKGNSAEVKQFGQMFKINPEVADIAGKYAIPYKGVDLLVLGAVQHAAGGCACRSAASPCCSSR